MLLLAHPRPDSYCHAIADRIRTVLTDAGADVRFHDLYAGAVRSIVSAEEAYTTGESVEAYLARESDTVVGRHRAELREARVSSSSTPIGGASRPRYSPAGWTASWSRASPTVCPTRPVSPRASHDRADARGEHLGHHRRT